MFKKILISIAIVLASFVTGYAAAQTFFNAKAPNAPGQNQTVMSPSDFQNRTQQLEQQKNQGLSSQLKDTLAKTPPPVLPPTPSPQTTPESGTATTGHEAAPQAEQPAAPTAQEQAPAGPTPTAPAPAPQKNTDVYTGFQNPGQQQSPQQTTPSSGGWNIKY